MTNHVQYFERGFFSSYKRDVHQQRPMNEALALGKSRRPPVTMTIEKANVENHSTRNMADEVV